MKIIERIKNFKRWQKNTILVIITIIIVYVMICIDVIMRARHAYLEGEKYWRWHFKPQLKIDYLNKHFDNEIKKLKKQLDKNKISKEEYERHLEILQFDKERQLEESSIKYAYVWYQTAVELFQPPRSKWIKLSEQKMKQAKQLWKDELTKQGIQYEDYMLE